MQKNRALPITIGVVAVLIAAGVVMYQGRAGATFTPPPVTTGAATSTYTLADVATHNSRTSCWTAINGDVYDVTTFISQHPGGSGAILSLCGIDGSSAFNGQHGGQARPASELATFKIGTLSQ